jgi:hypothetical protein
VFRHIVDVVVVLDQGVGISALLMGRTESARENFGVFLVKMDKDPGKSDLLAGVLPETFEAISLNQVLHNPELAPVAKTVFVFPETLGCDTGWVVDPVHWESRIKLLVIVSLKGQPASCNLLRVAELNAHAEEQVLNVRLGEVLLFLSEFTL